MFLLLLAAGDLGFFLGDAGEGLLLDSGAGVVAGF
jgi:hypothetical protein